MDKTLDIMNTYSDLLEDESDQDGDLNVTCFIDIFRRYEFIDIFYTNDSIISISTSSSFYKSFTLLTTFTTSWEVHLFFIIGLEKSRLKFIYLRLFSVKLEIWGTPIAFFKSNFYFAQNICSN